MRYNNSRWRESAMHAGAPLKRRRYSLLLTACVVKGYTVVCLIGTARTHC